MSIKFKSESVSNFYCLIFVFFLILGFKVSFIDLSILIPFFVIAISGKNLLKANRSFILFASFIILLISYQAILQVLHLTSDISSLLRLLRAAFVCLLIAIVIGGNIFPSSQILYSLFLTLLFHAILVNAAALYEPLNQFLVNFSGNDRVRPFRASGMLAGFDMAGLFCLLGFLLLIFDLIAVKSILLRLFLYFVFFLGSVFTSRVTLLLFILIFISKLFIYLTTSKDSFLRRIFLFCIIITSAAYLFYVYLLPIFELTFSLGLIDVSDSQATDIGSRNSLYSGESWKEMLFFPKDYSNLLFGIGIDQPDSDIGYVKDVFRYGVIGVLCSLVAHFYIIRFSFSQKYVLKNVWLFQYSVLCLILLLSIKNNYFFTRGIFPLFLLSLCLDINHLGFKSSFNFSFRK